MERPKLKLTLTTFDIALELLGWLALIALWGLTLVHFSDLPNTIPTHYNAAGKIDAYGSKNTIFILPIIGSVLFAGLTVLNRFPHIFNYPTEITPDNALRQYTNATRMIRVLKFVLVFIFVLIQLKTMQSAIGNTNGLGIWFLPATLLLIFIPLAYFVVKSVSAK